MTCLCGHDWHTVVYTQPDTHNHTDSNTPTATHPQPHTHSHTPMSTSISASISASISESTAHPHLCAACEREWLACVSDAITASSAESLSRSRTSLGPVLAPANDAVSSAWLLQLCLPFALPYGVRAGCKRRQLCRCRPRAWQCRWTLKDGVSPCWGTVRPVYSCWAHPTAHPRTVPLA